MRMMTLLRSNRKNKSEKNVRSKRILLNQHQHNDHPNNNPPDLLLQQLNTQELPPIHPPKEANGRNPDLISGPKSPKKRLVLIIILSLPVRKRMLKKSGK